MARKFLDIFLFRGSQHFENLNQLIAVEIPVCDLDAKISDYRIVTDIHGYLWTITNVLCVASERTNANNHFQQNATRTPIINLLGIRCISKEKLWGSIPQRDQLTIDIPA